MEYYDIGADFAKFLSKISRQRNENNSLQWYLSGSLAATILGKASSITDVVLDENNNIVGGGKSKSIDEEQ